MTTLVTQIMEKRVTVIVHMMNMLVPQHPTYLGVIGSYEKGILLLVWHNNEDGSADAVFELTAKPGKAQAFRRSEIEEGLLEVLESIF